MYGCTRNLFIHFKGFYQYFNVINYFFLILENGRKIIQKSYILNFVATVFVFAGIFVQYD